jgi:hypothetical protein
LIGQRFGSLPVMWAGCRECRRGRLASTPVGPQCINPDRWLVGAGYSCFSHCWYSAAVMRPFLL